MAVMRIRPYLGPRDQSEASVDSFAHDLELQYPER
jgi:hypothetical protein